MDVSTGKTSLQDGGVRVMADLWLQVAMQDTAVVAKLHTRYQLVKKDLHLMLWQALGSRSVKKLFQVEVEVLEDECQFLFCMNHVVKPDDIVMLQLLEDRYLADRSARDALILSLQADLLQSNKLTCQTVPCLVNNTIRALTNLFYFLVLLHDYAAASVEASNALGPRSLARRQAREASVLLVLCHNVLPFLVGFQV